MLVLPNTATSLCDGLSRRDWLQIGSLGAFGLTLPTLLKHQQAQAAPSRPKKAKSVILLFLLGAPPQQETWDPKPDSAAEYRGDMKPMTCATPGWLIGETFIKTAKLTNKIALLRACQTKDNAHSSSGYTMTTGMPHAPMNAENVKPGAPNDWPSVGAIVRKVLKNDTGLPSAFTLPEQAANDGNITWPGQDAGFLGRAYDPWLMNCDPNSKAFGVPGLDLPAEVNSDRFSARQTLLSRIESQTAALERGLPTGSDPHSLRTRLAFEMIASPMARRAFQLDDEDPTLRDRYGRTRFGQSCLLARRLVESGVPLIRVNWTRVPNAPNNGHWDTHSKNTDGTKALGPILDTAYSALIEDLADRGLLEETLVVWMGEFGRTPKLNGNGGRDHWGHVFTMALAGGGVRGGTIHGASDKIAAYPKDGLVRPQDFLATIYHSLGIPLDTEIVDSLGRPFPITRGQVVREIF
jgi:hypothetical protein